MKNLRIYFILTVALSFAFQCAAEKIGWKSLPAEVRKTAHPHFAKITHVEKRNENNVTTYKINGGKNGKPAEMELDPNGKIIYAREERTLSDLPAVAQETLKNLVGAKLGKVVKATDDGEISFDVEVTKGGRIHSLEFDDEGILSRDEVEITFKEIPVPAQKTIVAELGNGKIISLTKVMEGDEVSYEIEANKNDRPINFEVAADGDLLGYAIALGDVPIAIQETIKQNLAGGKLEQIDKTSEDGEIYYDVEISHGSKGISLSIFAEGTLVSKEEELTLAEMPAAVQKSIQEKAFGKKITSLRRTTENEQTFYQIEVTKSGKDETLQLSADGNIFKPKSDQP
ncbi:MAG: PepSY-like domain-containing protein [Verrucomicrobiota bacterium]|nr:PepSY-like domain-containing protein [Verrucomicrobiota bacterium]